IWIAGWFDRDHPLELPAVVVDQGNHPAAVVLTSYERDDLPERGIGFVGLIASDWQPNSRNQVFLYFGPSGRYHLPVLNPLPIRAMRNFVEHFESIRRRCLAGRVSEFHRMLNSPEAWVPYSPQALGYHFEAFIDSALILPHFGCFAEGWQVSPVKRLEYISFKL